MLCPETVWNAGAIKNQDLLFLIAAGVRAGVSGVGEDEKGVGESSLTFMFDMSITVQKTPIIWE